VHELAHVKPSACAFFREPGRPANDILPIAG
jgi:hypothetical protein